MAINATNSNTAQPTAPAAPQRSFLGGSIFGAPISRTISSEYLNKIADGLREAYKSANADYELKVISIDRQNEQALFYSLIVVAATMKSNPKLTACHVLLIEASGDTPRPFQANIMDQQIDIMRVSSDVFDDRLYKIVHDLMLVQFPGQRIIFVDGCVVPSVFDATDASKIHALALNAGMACGTELLQHSPGFEDLNIAKDAAGLVSIPLKSGHGSDCQQGKTSLSSTR